MNWDRIFKDDLKSDRLRQYYLIITTFLILTFDNLHAFIKIGSFANIKPYIEIVISIAYWYVLALITIFLFSKKIIPGYLAAKKYKSLFLISILSWIGIYIVALTMSYLYQFIFYPLICNCNEEGSAINTVFLANYYTFVMYIPLSIFLMAFYFMQSFYREVVQQTQLIKEKTESELNLQQRKVHPGFFLTSIRALMERPDSEQDLTKLVLLFSNVLSFILYDSNSEKVNLVKELEVANDLIEFQKCLYSRNFSLTVHFKAEVMQDELVPLTIINPLVNFFVRYSAHPGSLDKIVLYVDQLKSTLYTENETEQHKGLTDSYPGLSFENVNVR